MRKPKFHSIMYNSKAKRANRLYSIFIIVCWLLLLTCLYYFNVSFISSVIFCFLFFILAKWLPSPCLECIEIYFDRLIYKSKVKEIEIGFKDVAFIDQDVVEGESPFYKSIELLNESMESLLYIDGKGYSYENLVTLCNRIYEVNNSYDWNTPSKEKLFSVGEEEPITWERL